MHFAYLVSYRHFRPLQREMSVRALAALCNMCLYLLFVPVCPKLTRTQPSSLWFLGLLLPWLVSALWFACSRVSLPFIAPCGGRMVAVGFTVLHFGEGQFSEISNAHLLPLQEHKEAIPFCFLVEIFHGSRLVSWARRVCLHESCTHSYFSCWDAWDFICREGTQSFAISCLETEGPLD